MRMLERRRAPPMVSSTDESYPLTHIGADGGARMVDVSDKAATDRVAVAEGRVRMAAPTLTTILSGDAKKGDVIEAVRLIEKRGGKSGEWRAPPEPKDKRR